jgi:hypothetical protein
LLVYSTVLVVVIALVLVQWHYARIITAAVPLLRSENPVSSQIEKLIPDSQLICQSGKPHAFIRVADALLLGGHGEVLSQAGAATVASGAAGNN